MQKRALVVLALAFGLSAAAQEAAAPVPPLKSVADARKLADKAMGLFQKEKLAEGYDVLKPYWPLPPIEIDSIANTTATQWPIVEQRYGASIGTEFLTEQPLGNSFVRLIYLQKFERHAIRWVFIFYKPNDRWIVNSFSFDDSISAMF
ncbi:MAG TPA: hypothetical protein VEU30_08970 [Thermoanaerobaculia bacterium]|nr:hypothetical protein [Thermoanaerobaculia bacterium]